MNCRGVSRRLSAFIDKTLTPGIQQSVENHLEGCGKCQRRLKEIEAIILAANNLPSLKVSEGFTDNVVNAVFKSAAKKEVSHTFGYKLMFSSAAFVAAAMAVFFFVGPSSDNFNNEIGNPELITEEVNSEETQFDYVQDPRAKVYSVPVPEEILRRDQYHSDSIMLADSSSKIDEFILPEVERVKENVNVEF